MKFTAAVLALAAVSSAQAFTVSLPARNGISVEWTTTNNQNDFDMKMTDNVSANGYACIGISYGSNGGYHNSMESYCAYNDNGTRKLYVGPSNSKSMPVFPGGQNPTGYTQAPANSVLQAVAVTTNGGNTVSDWTRTKANKYAGADVSKETMNDGRFLNKEWYYEDNKEYVIWYASGGGKNLNQKHDGTGKWSNKEELFRVTDPLTQNVCPADYVCEASTLYTGERKPQPQNCAKQNTCSTSDCCVRAAATANDPDPIEDDPTSTPGGDGTGDEPITTTPTPGTPAIKNYCSATFTCPTPGWKHIDEITIQGCIAAECEVSECCVDDGSGLSGTNTGENFDRGNGSNAAAAFAPSVVTALLAGIASIAMYL